MTPDQDRDPRNHWCRVAGCAAWGSFGKDRVWGCAQHLPPGWQERRAEAVPAQPQGALL